MERNPRKISGAWAFTGTRVPVYALFENLASGATIEEFVEWFPDVDEQQVRAVLQYEADALSTAEDSPEHRSVVFDQWLTLGDRSPDGPCIGPARRVEVAGRCADCWGPLAGMVGRDRNIVRLECRLCGRGIGEDGAEREVERMRREADRNLPQARVGRAAVYRSDARFVLKLLPDMDRDPLWFKQRITASLARKPKPKHVGRRDFQSRDADTAFGAAGYLYGQARALVFGLSNFPRNLSVIGLSDFDLEKAEPSVEVVQEEKSVSIRVSSTVPYKRPSTETARARKGAALIAGMTGAFACEVGMKAILITRLDEARKTHDLQQLYESLPDDSRARLEGDFWRIGDVLKEYRHSFGRWRYFQGDALTHAATGLVNTERVHELGKAARVILDECVLLGLQFDDEFQYWYRFQTTGYVGEDFRFQFNPQSAADAASSSTKVKCSFVGHESAIPWQEILALDPDG